MPRAMPCATLAVVMLLAAIVGVGVATSPAAGSPQPTPFCGVCGQMFHENVTATQATLAIQTNGDIVWRVENEMAEPTASEWRADSEAAERAAREALDRGYGPPDNPTDLAVEVREDTVVVTFVDPDATRQRLGLLVVPYFHGEGSVYRWVVNADELVVVAPDGHRIVNEPAGATVDGDRAIWTGAIGEWMSTGGTTPEPGDTYVVAGRGVTADARAALVTPLLPLDPFRYGLYVVGLLTVAGLTFGIYTIQGYRLGPRRVATGVALPSVSYLVAVWVIHPVQLSGLEGFVLLLYGILLTFVLGLLGGVALYATAARVASGREEVRP